jgi:NADH-quinone oxidoreductase subunit L
MFKGWSYGQVATFAGILLFLGACGKSAQIPLYVWLPDAMAGPTPVSALIHAATMVTAGVYMVARMGFLYSLSPVAMGVVACVGTLTALVAASMGLVQNDIKKVLAYSTISQLGYMFTAVGVGAYSAGVFHLFTHAFFKACLFLGAGSVIHGMGGEQDIRKMGGLREFMPHTYWTFLAASLALAGVAPFAGFFSKDEILLAAFASGLYGALGKFLWAIGFITAGMTAFYMFRLVFLAFHGECRADRAVQHHIHESPFSMVSMLWILAAGSLAAGFLGFPHWNPFGEFVDEAVRSDMIAVAYQAHPVLGLELVLAAASVFWAVCWIMVARHFYLEAPHLPEDIAKEYGAAYRLLSEKGYVDAIYEGGVVQPIWAAARGFLFKVVDARVIDGIVNGLGLFTRLFGEVIRIFQTGVVRTYVIFLLTGVLFVLGYLVL